MNKSLSVEIEKAYTTKREALNFTVLNVTSTVVKLWINFTDPKTISREKVTNPEMLDFILIGP